MTHWGGIHANIQCTIASCSKIKSIISDRENDQGETEQGTIAAPQVSAEPQLEEMMNRMMVGIMTKVDEKLKSVSDNSLPRVSNQSFAIDKVIPSPEIVPVTNSKNSFERARGHLVHRTPCLSFLVEKIHQARMKNPMSNRLSM